MSVNLIDLIKGQLGPALITQASTQFGESESGISKAISGLLPAVVGGMARNASNPTLLDAIFGSASQGYLNNLVGGTSDNSVISAVLNTIFGGRASDLFSSVASFAGVNNSTVNSLANMVTGATLGTVSKYASDQNLDRAGVSRLLEQQKSHVSALLPAGLSLASLGLGDFTTSTTNNNLKDKTMNTNNQGNPDVNRAGNTHVNVDRKDNNSIWKWLLPLLLLLLAGWFLWKQCDKKNPETPMQPADSTVVVEDSTMVDTAAVTAPANRGELQDIDLNGTALRGYPNGLEQRMISYLQSGQYANANEEGLKAVWYDFDNVNFVHGSKDQLEAGSEAQIENLAKILKAYPDAKVKIGGYTDKTGNEAVNKEISQGRANFIKSQLEKYGVGSQVTGAEGYGSEFATVDASASDAERAKDRKMAVRFSK
ncbi:DUF937 domain-containing protein [Cruoricaptor ignavus]|uniref:DUF937 domain-containing protein n=1 Tax=Cruoricaptor ignavus TaxID=1118202 RepID=A0A7M1T3G2_9FLAO|nr:OmpA family protein [Cruoricaptor ignavus]QOR74408.1 DUF937 domain-containing protein [Cruoricaptor ignavus]